MILLNKLLKLKCSGSKTNFNSPKTKRKESLSWATSHLGNFCYHNFLYQSHLLDQINKLKTFPLIVSEATHMMVPTSGINNI